MSVTLYAACGAGGVDPSRPPLAQLARIRGAMWTRRAPVPYGPRPGAPDNCVCIDYYEAFAPTDRATIKAAYIDAGRYTHAPMGPLVDPGYHGQLPASDFRRDPSPYFDAADDLQAALRRGHTIPNGGVIHFVRPDRGVAGLDWTIDDLDRELGPIFASARAQASMQIVCLGWEPGPIYFYNNAWWVSMCQWLARTFPNALRLIHMVADCDAPVGQDDDVKGISNGQGWANVAPYIHGYLAQYGGYVGDGVTGQSVADFLPNFQNALRDMQDRFNTGRGGWPRSSAWGAGAPVRVYAGEYAAFRAYWGDAPESDSITLGNAAIAAGACGYLDGGSVEVP